MRRGELPDDVLERRAIIYVRQSTGAQVQDNLESQRRQYELKDLAQTYGFRDVVTIDDDLGRSASGLVARPGFEALVAQLCQGAVGAVLCLEASRLARNGRDWHHMLELCGLVGARVIDLDGVYDPSVPNDRLLLGLKGTMSEFELTLMRRRLIEGIEARAQRGEYRIAVPIGYLWSREMGLEMDPDRRVQEAIRTIFRLFDRFESGRQVLLHMVREGIGFPRPAEGRRHGPPGNGSRRSIGISSRCCRIPSMLACGCQIVDLPRIGTFRPGCVTAVVRRFQFSCGLRSLIRRGRCSCARRQWAEDAHRSRPTGDRDD